MALAVMVMLLWVGECWKLWLCDADDEAGVVIIHPETSTMVLLLAHAPPFPLLQLLLRSGITWL